MSLLPNTVASGGQLPGDYYFSLAGGGGGGAQALSQSGNSVSLSGGGGAVNIAATTSVASSAQKTTAMTYDGGLLSTSIDGDLFTKRAQVGSALEPTTFTVFQNIDQYGDSAIHQFYTSASVPQGSIGLVSGVNLNIASSGGLTINKANTGSGGGSIDIIDGQVRMRATEYVGVEDGTDIRLSGGLIDNSLSSGSASQFLSCGAGDQVVWATIPGGSGIVAVNAGTNISIPDPGIPVVSLAISSAIEMNAYNITSTGALAVQSDVSVSLDAPFVYLPQIPSASTSKMLYYDDTTKEVSYSDAPPADGVQSVVAGSNISVDNTDPANPIVAVAVSSDLLMAGNDITSVGALAVQSDVSLAMDAPLLTLPSLASASAPKMLYYDDTTKAVSYSDPPPVDGVQSVVAGSNIAVDVTDPANPIVAVAISSTLDMNTQAITNALTVDGATLGLDANGNLRLGDATTGVSPTFNNAVAIGVLAGSSAQGSQTVAIGYTAGQTSQSNFSVAIGIQAGQTNQGNEAVAIGQSPGNENQGVASVAIGSAAGYFGQGEYAVAIGSSAGSSSQGAGAIAIGKYVAQQGQGADSIQIGSYTNVAHDNQGAGSICIGAEATYSSAANSILINATGSAIGADNAGLYVAPVRATPAEASTQKAMFYDTATNELTANDAVSYTVANAITLGVSPDTVSYGQLLASGTAIPSIVGGAATLSATSGGNSGQHLQISINGTIYKIRLENNV